MAYDANALELAKQGMRLVRDEALRSTDEYMIIDRPIPADELAKIKRYREYLRNLPSTLTDEDFMTFSGVVALKDFEN